MDIAVSPRPMEILLVEDDPGDAFLVQEILTEVETSSFQLTHVGCLRDVLEKLDDVSNRGACPGRVIAFILLPWKARPSSGVSSVDVSGFSYRMLVGWCRENFSGSVKRLTRAKRLLPWRCSRCNRRVNIYVYK